MKISIFKKHKFKIVLALTLVTILTIAVPIFAKKFYSSKDQAWSIIATDAAGKRITTFVKSDENTKPVYCMNRNAENPSSEGTDYTFGSEINTKEVYNVLLYGFPNHRYSSDPVFDYMITQVALWEQMGASTGNIQIPGGVDGLSIVDVDSNIKINCNAQTPFLAQHGFTSALNGQSVTGDYFKACVNDLLTQARNANNSQRVGIEVSEDSVTATYNSDKKYYISDYIQLSPIGGTLNSNNQEQLQDLTLTVDKEIPGLCVYSATGQLLPFNGTTWDGKLKVDAKIAIAIPEGTDSSTLNFTISGNVKYNSVVEYIAPSNVYQNIAVNTSETVGQVTENFSVHWKLASGSAEIIKVDADTNQPLEGVEFKLVTKDLNGKWSIVSTKKTDAQGKISWSGLPLGYYKVVELETLPGYELKQEHVELGNITADGQKLTVTITNKKEVGSVKLTKTNHNGTENLQGVKFQLLDEKGNVAKYADGTTVPVKTTDAQGVIRWDNLALGTYRIKETETLAGYRLLDTEKVVIISTANQVVGVTISNSKQSGFIQITKKGDDGKLLENVEFAAYTDKECTKLYAKGVTDSKGIAILKFLLVGQKYYIKEIKGANGYVLDGTVWEATIGKDKETLTFERINKKEKGSVEITKTTDTKQVLEGAKFQLLDANKNPIGTPKTTGKDGIARWDNLDLGTYYVKETEAPKGYALDEREFEVTVSTNGDIAREEIVNVPVKGAIKISKTDISSKRLLAGAEFTLYDLDGNRVQLANRNPNPSTTKKNGICTFSNVPAGEYIIKETKAPVGYQLDPTEHRINTIDNNNAYITLDIPNEKYPFRLKVIKVDKDTTVTLQGAEFVLLDENDKAVTEDENPSTPNEWNSKVYVTDENGEIFMDEDLDFGTYKLVEVKAPEGYKGISDPLVFTINEDTSYDTEVISDKETRIYTIKVGNNRGTGTLEITKKDVSTGELLPNTKFKIYAADKTTVVTEGVTDENGVATFTLLTGQYYYQEFEAPKGYQIDTALYPFEIKEDGEIVKCEMTNTKLPSTGFVTRNLVIPTIAVVGLGCLYIVLRVRKKHKQ